MIIQNRRLSGNVEDRRGAGKITNPSQSDMLAGDYGFSTSKQRLKGYTNYGSAPDEVMQRSDIGFMWPARTAANGTARSPSLRSPANERAEKANKKNIENIWRTGGGF